MVWYLVKHRDNFAFYLYWKVIVSGSAKWKIYWSLRVYIIDNDTSCNFYNKPN